MPPPTLIMLSLRDWPSQGRDESRTALFLRISSSIFDLGVKARGHWGDSQISARSLAFEAECVRSALPGERALAEGLFDGRFRNSITPQLLTAFA
jgi:hypothetical protein